MIKKKVGLGMIILLLLSVSVFSYLPSAYAIPAGCPPGMIHYWKLDETAAPYIDFYAGNNATCTDCPSAVTGIVNGAQQFTSTTQVNVPNDGTFDWLATDSFSIEFWMKTDPASTCSGNQVVVGRKGNSGGLFWVGCYDGGTAGFELYDKDGNGTGVGGTTSLTDGQWHHVVGVRDGEVNQILIYVDGLLENSVPVTYSTGFDFSVPLNIGWLNLNNGYNFVGVLDEVALYSSALSNAEVLQQMNDKVSPNGYCPQPTISVTPTPYNFGSVTVGSSSAVQTFTMTNNGPAANLSISSVGITGTGAAQFVKQSDNCSGHTLAYLDTCIVGVIFSPTSGGIQSGNLSISSNDPTMPVLNISLAGTSTIPIISDTPASYDFGFATVGSSSAVQTFTIINNGLAANLFMSSVGITGTDAAQFVKQSDNCSGHTLAYLANCTIGVTFSPTSTGIKSANLSISSNDPTTPVLNIALTGSNSVTEIGVYRSGAWYLDNNGSGTWDGCGVDTCLPAFGGSADDIPVVGNWNGDLSRKEKIGVFRDGQWFLDLNGNGAWDGCGTDACYASFGMTGDIPIVGDWTGTGTAKIGVFRDGQWFLDLNGNGAWDGCGTDACYASFGMTGDIPIVGDWTGKGTAKIGVFRDGQWFLDLNGNGAWDGCGTDGCYSFGEAGDIPVFGDWSGNGTPKIGVFRNGAWFLDYNGDRAWSGCGAAADPTKDTCFESFGMTSDHPVAGRLER